MDKIGNCLLKNFRTGTCAASVPTVPSTDPHFSLIRKIKMIVFFMQINIEINIGEAKKQLGKAKLRLLKAERAMRQVN